MFCFIKGICNRQDNIQENKIMETELELAKKEMKERTKTNEGLRLKPYRCPANKLSIGYGRNLEDNGISKEEAEILLDHDIQTAEKELKQNFPWTEEMSARRKYVLVEMVFNMGIAKFKQFKNMLSACQYGDFEKASIEAKNSLWAKQVGKRADTLIEILKEG